MDGWEVEDELQVERTGGEFVCRFSFPDGDPREDKMLAYLHRTSAVWQPVKN